MNNLTDILSTLTVLYVEDEEISRTIAKKYLKKIVDEVYVAKNGKEGLDIFRTIKPHIIISDLNMPEINGIDMIKNIREVDKDCGIIISTQIGDLEYVLQSIDIGIDKYLIKPITKENLLEALEIVVKKVNGRGVFNDDKNFNSELDAERRKDIDDKIKNEISNLLKQSTGKGPQNVKIYRKKNLIFIRMTDVLTAMELSLLENKSNATIVEYNRKLFYKNKKHELQQLIGHAASIEARLKSVSINVIENTEQIVLELLDNI